MRYVISLSSFGTCQIVPDSRGALTTCVACGWTGKACCPGATENDACNVLPNHTTGNSYCKADVKAATYLTCTDCDLSYTPLGDRCCPGVLSSNITFKIKLHTLRCFVLVYMIFDTTSEWLSWWPHWRTVAICSTWDQFVLGYSLIYIHSITW